MLIDPTRKAITELRGTTLGIFTGVVRAVHEDVVWVLLHCGDRWCFIPRHLAPGAYVAEELTLRCWQTPFGVCGKPLQAPIREGHTRRRKAA